MSNPVPSGLVPGSGGVTPVTQISVYNATFAAISGAAVFVSSILSGAYFGAGASFDPTNSNDVILLQIATQQLQAIVGTSSNTLKSVFTAVQSVIANI